MYSILLVFHSAFRWLVLASLLFSILQAYSGVSKGKSFSKTDDSLRHWTATFFHIQLILGITLYIKSPIVHYFWKNISEAFYDRELLFFGLIHFLLMLTSVVLVTIGSALAKRKTTSKEKYRTILLWFSIALFIILIAIPWPFSPLANRPSFRIF